MTVTVARYFEPSEAHVVRALLESELLGGARVRLLLLELLIAL